MRHTGILVAIVAVVFATSAGAQEVGTGSGNVSAAKLADFGIGGLQPLSDSQGQQIRGSGFVWVGSFSYALGDIDRTSRSSAGAPRFVRTRARGFGGFTYRARSSGFAFAAAR